MPRVISWVFSRVALIYVVILIFCLTCVDLKTLQGRLKIRSLNDAIPNFSYMVSFSQDPHLKNNINWKPYKDYFQLILRYMPDDVISKQLMGYVDYYSGHEQQAIEMFKNSSSISGHLLFLSNDDLGVLYYKKGMWPQAAEYLLKAISSSPDIAILLMQHSVIYSQIFNSSPTFRFSLEDSLNDAQSRAYILLLSSLYHMGQYDKVIYIAGLAIDNPRLLYKDAFYYYGGLSFLQAGQLEKAFVFFQKSLAIEKNNPDVYYYLGDIYQHAGKLEQARDFYQTSLVMHQKNDQRFPYESRVHLQFF